MEGPSCQHCYFLTEPLYEMPCCASLHCEKCIFSKARCPHCFRSFDFSQCTVYRPLNIGDVLIKCKYPECDYKTSDILIKNHEKDCKKATFNETLMEVLMEPQERPETVAFQRTINILRNFSEFSNVAKVLCKLTGEKKVLEETIDRDYFTHMILDTDTLQGLAIKYRCSVQEIKELNQLRTDVIHERAALKIPQKHQTSDESEMKVEDLQKMLEAKLICKFKLKARCTTEEAKYYLEETNMEFSKAFMIFAGDNEWSKAADPPFCPSLPVRRGKNDSQVAKRRNCCSLFFM